jgi:hypothetical protein
MRADRLDAKASELRDNPRAHLPHFRSELEFALAGL